MAIFHMNVQAISRKDGRSALASAAYRAGAALTDEATGEAYDFTKKRGIVSAAILLPDNAPEWAQNRQQLWARAEAAERRGDACIAHEVEIALPNELTAQERQQLAHDFARLIVRETGCAVDVAIHRPQRSKEQDERNHHAHILVCERPFDGNDFAKKKPRIWNKDKVKDKNGNDTKRGQSQALVEKLRQKLATYTNAALAAAGHEARIDHRSHAERGISKPPSTHDGWALTKAKRAVRRIERQLADVQQEIKQHLAAAALLAPTQALVLETVPPPSQFTRRSTAAEEEAEERRRYEAARRALAADADPQSAARDAVLDAIRQQEQAQAGQGGGLTVDELLALGQPQEPPAPPPTRGRGRDDFTP